MKLKPLLIVIISSFSISNAEPVFNSAFGVKFNEPYNKNVYTGNKILISPPLTDNNIFDRYEIVLNSKNLVEGIFAAGFSVGKKMSCQEAMLGLSSRFYLKYKNSFVKEQTDYSYDFTNKDYIVSFMCFENTFIFSAIKQ